MQEAGVGTLSMWVRPFAAIGAGLLADRFGVARLTMVSLLILGIGSAVIAAGGFRPGVTVFFFSTLIATSAAVLALRGLYYAMMEKIRATNDSCLHQKYFAVLAWSQSSAAGSGCRRRRACNSQAFPSTAMLPEFLFVQRDI